MAWRHNPRQRCCICRLVCGLLHLQESDPNPQLCLHTEGVREVEERECETKEGSLVDLAGCGGYRHAKWECVSPSCGLKVVAEQGFWFLRVPYLTAAGVFLSAFMGLWQKVGNQLFGGTGLCCVMVPLCISQNGM